MASKDQNFFDYIHTKKEYRQEIIDDFFPIINLYREQLQFIHNSAPIFYLYDFATDQYIFISSSLKNILGYTPQYVMDGGIHEYSRHLKPEDLDIYNRFVFPANFGLLKSVPVTDQKEYVFTTNYRIESKKGEILTLMEKYMYIRSALDGSPLVSLGFAFDISDMKSDTKIIHTARHIKNGITESDHVFRNCYFVKDAERILSVRESEIMKWISEGFTSKQIADKLHVSFHTVNNHKKNIREKTNCKNAAELLKYAIDHGLI